MITTKMAIQAYINSVVHRYSGPYLRDWLESGDAEYFGKLHDYVSTHAFSSLECKPVGGMDQFRTFGKLIFRQEQLVTVRVPLIACEWMSSEDGAGIYALDDLLGSSAPARLFVVATKWRRFKEGESWYKPALRFIHSRIRLQYEEGVNRSNVGLIVFERAEDGYLYIYSSVFDETGVICQRERLHHAIQIDDRVAKPGESVNSSCSCKLCGKEQYEVEIPMLDNLCMDCIKDVFDKFGNGVLRR